MRRLKAISVALALIAAPALADEIFYAHTDLLGNVVLVTDENRNIVERRVYEPYGLPRTPIPDGPGFTGHDMDGDTGLVYMQQRYYDPEVGRFLSVDPVGADPATGANFNRYWYANDNPYKYVDPDGELAFLIPVAIIAYRAYSTYDTATSTVANVQTLSDSNASTLDKAVAGAELVGSLLGGKLGQKAAGGMARAAGKAPSNRTASRAEGIPDSQIGPSGLPKRHTVVHNTRKEARESAEHRAPMGGSARNDANPTDSRQGPHFQAENAKGKNVQPVVHDEYPKRFK